MKLVITALGLVFLALPVFAGDWEDGYHAGYEDGFNSGKNQCADKQRRYLCNLYVSTSNGGVENWSMWRDSFEEAEQEAFDDCLANPRVTGADCRASRRNVECFVK